MADEKKTIKFQMMLAPSEAEAYDDWSFANRVRSRAEAIRRLASLGLNHESANNLASAATAVALKFLSKEPPTNDEVKKFLDALQQNMERLKKRTQLALDTHADLLVEMHVRKNADRNLTYEQARAEISDQIAAVYQADADLAVELEKKKK